MANKKHKGNRPETRENEIDRTSHNFSLHSVSPKVKANATASCGANGNVITR